MFFSLDIREMANSSVRKSARKTVRKTTIRLRRLFLVDVATDLQSSSKPADSLFYIFKIVELS